MEITRTAIPKRLRFEVLKRDCFKCRYCGKTAEETKLHIDHVKPVAAGGLNDLMNLVTACEACNLGKSDKPLSDSSVASKARKQAELMQEQREILEMMAEWRSSLKEFEEEKIGKAFAYLNEQFKGYSFKETVIPDFKKMVKGYSFDEICDAIDTSVAQYLKYDNSGSCDPKSMDTVFEKVGGILNWKKINKENPTLGELFKIRAMAKKRCNYFVDWKALDALKKAHSLGVSLTDLKNAAYETTNFKNFMESIEFHIAEAEFNAAQIQNSPVQQISQSTSNQTTELTQDQQLNLEKILRFKEIYADTVQGNSVEGLKSLGGLCYGCEKLIKSRADINVYRRWVEGKYTYTLGHDEEADCFSGYPEFEHFCDIRKFSGTNAFVEIAELIQDELSNQESIASLIKRLFVPGFEFTRFHFNSAKKADVINQYLVGTNNYWDWQIDATLKWMGASGSILPVPSGFPEATIEITH